MNIDQQIEQMIGRCPVGNPQRMRDNAHKLQGLAIELETQAEAVKAAKIDGAGGLVRRNWDWTDARTAQVRSAARDLRELAATLLGQATDIATNQSLWNQSAEKIRSAAASAPAQAAHR